MTARPSQTRDNRLIALWLLACAALVFAMVVLGGVTRLTRSGLSITEWDPILGAIPPLDAAQWNDAFGKYRQTPEFQQVNRDMTLDGFKSIYYVEWAHRLLGRLIGFAFLLPFLYLLLRRRIERALAPRLIGLFALGALQGALGWFMVKSGLVDVPRVSPYRLTAHLGLAVVIYGYLVWTALSLVYPQAPVAAEPARRWSRGVVALVFVMILSGGFVAGTHAGFAYNTFPLMGGRWIPDGIGALEPWWSNPFENPPLVQFDHRLIAYTLLIVVPMFWWRLRRATSDPRLRAGAHALLALLGLQISLGIATLLYVVPVPLAAAHQGCAILVFTAALYVAHGLRRPASPPAPAGA